MIRVKISTASGGKPFMKQLPSQLPFWENCQFFINEPVEQCDAWIVYGGLMSAETTYCPSNSTLLITNEPPSVKKYSKSFTEQFSTMMTCEGMPPRKNQIFNQQALPWWVGHKINNNDSATYEKTYDELLTLQTPRKTKLISVISSNKTFTKGHRKRCEFIKMLQKEFPNLIDVYGLGFNMINDKWDAIASYRYHIVIENDSRNDYWSEKLSDCYLAESYPIYHGCPNISKYFTDDMITQIDINNHHEAIKVIREIIAGEAYEHAGVSLKKAKDLILNKYQLFPLLHSYVNSIPPSEAVKTTLVPERKSGIVLLLQRYVRAARRRLGYE